MAAADPYSTCPCGSGEKYKFCCQKVEAYAERSQRAIESGQLDTALRIFDEGLKTSPESPWLNINKAMVLARREKFAEARAGIDKILASRPAHPLAHATRVRLAIQGDELPTAVGLLQEALARVPSRPAPDLAEITGLVGSILAEMGRTPSALAHLRLAATLDPEGSGEILQALRMVEGNPSIAPHLRNPDALSPRPDGLEEARGRRFDEALALAARGLWAPAAAIFDELSKVGTPESDRNLGLCRLWLADLAGAVDAFRRYSSWIGANPGTVDMEALCQLVAPPPESDRVSLLQWIWPLRDRDGLIDTLRKEPRAHAEGREPIDPNDPDSPEVDTFLLLDRPAAPLASIAGPGDVPRVQGRLLVGREIVALEAFDDGRLDRLATWFRTLADEAIPPAHPRTKSVGRATRSGLALRTEWLLPEGLEPQQVRELTRAERRRVITEVWPNQPHPALAGLSPREAARAGGHALALRAALEILDVEADDEELAADVAALRSELGLEPEPAIDPSTVDVEAVHLARLHRIDPATLDDARLVAFFSRVHRFVLPRSLVAAAQALAARPSALERPDAPPYPVVFGDLASLALGREGIGAALEWISRGRQAEPPARRSVTELSWDLLELRLRARGQGPEEWVPFLAALLERHRAAERSSPTILSTLAQMGLVQLVPSPDRPGEMYLDTRTLQALIERYGPRITTSTGELGVAAARPGIWTPGSGAPAPAGGGLWTPGQPRPAEGSGGKPGLILPGR